MSPDLYLYPVSANPLHSGHLAIAQFITDGTGCEVVFEICKDTYDKGKINDDDIAKRLKQFSMIGRECIVTENTSFVEKASCTYFIKDDEYEYEYDNHYFVVGYDTIKRIDDPKYYFNSEAEKNRCIKLIGELGWKFIVFPRKGKIDESLSKTIKDLCIFCRDFKEVDISSTELRNESDKKKVPLGCVQFGKCFTKWGNKYKLLNTKNNKDYTKVKVFNGEEFIVMPFDGVMVTPVDEDFYPYMDVWGEKV